ncbi:sigma-54-dependent transcriptional regulator [Chondrinema litorale]|uniref:sigma-54-dependent transcriptional regulator n=1 Tax=Chondrinema litorale TaxID=2994555 RepID=UPI002543BBB8|nr:sigma-54 dependent transcriptional regulator [Chondrinema litorale]UZR98198.1 sigma-54 dependent transcriptional regulator [Chondrinema litorale]
MQSILIVDDDVNICKILVKFLEKKGYQADSKSNAKDAIELVKKSAFDVILIDFRLPDEDGVNLMQKVKIFQPKAKVIIITGYSDVKIAVKAMKTGAFDYITKPLQPDEILFTIKEAIKHEEKKSVDHSKPVSKTEFIIGKSAAAKKVVQHIDLVAPTNMTVIIKGDTGTGKEYAARMIHDKSKRADKPFVAIDCGSLTNELAGSELFGHEKGAFTGAVNAKAGSFEYGQGGTLFLDEIGNLNYEIQVKLLRVLQERKVSRIGSNKEKDIDVRVIVASNDDLKEKVTDGRFREDLYHRLNEFNLDIAPIRDKKEDILTFAQHFLKLANRDLGKSVKGLNKDVEKIFLKYPWYGNLRELKNVVKRSVLLCNSDFISKEHLPHEIVYYNYDSFEEEDDPNAATDLKSTAEMAEKKAIIKALNETDYNKTKAAKLLNIDRKTLYNKLNEYKIDL